MASVVMQMLTRGRGGGSRADPDREPSSVPARSSPRSQTRRPSICRATPTLSLELGAIALPSLVDGGLFQTRLRSCDGGGPPREGDRAVPPRPPLHPHP